MKNRKLIAAIAVTFITFSNTQKTAAQTPILVGMEQHLFLNALS